MRNRGAHLILTLGLGVLVACAGTDPGLRSRDSQKAGRVVVVDPGSDPASDPTLDPGTDPTAVPGTDAPPATDETSTPPATDTSTGPLDPDPVVTAPELPPIPAGQFPLDPDKPPQDYDAYLIAALDDIQQFWRDSMPTVYGRDYEELQGGIYPVYPGKTGVPGCGAPRTSYQEIEGNAFYCQDGDFVAYDDSTLLPQLDRDLGRAVIGVVLAHEWGHAIQARVGLFDGTVSTVTAELQADCFAGSWTAHLSRGENPKMQFLDSDIRSGLTGMISVADAPGITSETDFSAHGSAFARVGAFQDGFVSGATQCATYADNPPNPMQFQYTSNAPNAEDALYADQPIPADRTYGDGIFQLIDHSLNAYWPGVMDTNGTPITPPTLLSYPKAGPYPACDGVDESNYADNVFFCAATNQVMYDDDLGQELYQRIGDFSIGYLIADGWSDAVQTALGSKLGGERRALLNDCLTGAWVKSTLPVRSSDPNATGPDVTASPGDLDEAVKTAILVGDETNDTNQVGSAFEKIDAFRVGVLGDLNACQTKYAA